MGKRVVVIEWEKINLVVPEIKDIEIWFRGINNPEIQFLLWQNRQYYRENEESYYKSLTEKRDVFFMIQIKETSEIIWSIWLNEESQINRNWILWIVIYNEKNLSLWYGSEAIRLFEKYVFEFLWYEKIVLKVNTFNERAIKSYKKCWFQEVWILKRDQYLKWEYYDTLIMEVMKEDYFNNKK